MIDITSFIQYIKIKWIKRFFDNPGGNWQILLPFVLNIHTDLKHVWFLGHDKLLKLHNRTTNAFWKDVISSTALLKNRKLLTQDYLKLDIRNFCHFDEFGYYQTWHDNGIKTLNDLIDENGNFIDFGIISRKIKSNNFLKYYQIINQIPNQKKMEIKDFKINNELYNQSYENNPIQKLISRKNLKYIYNELRDKEFLYPNNRIDKWKNELHFTDGENFSKYFSFAHSCTVDT